MGVCHSDVQQMTDIKLYTTARCQSQVAPKHRLRLWNWK